jgi:hypothetical protein
VLWLIAFGLAAGVSAQPLTRRAAGDRPMVLDATGDPYAGDFLFVTTPHGIYEFNRSSGTWGRITRAHGLPDNSVRVLGLDDGILWAATPAGLASADLKVNDWQAYDLPGEVQGLAFDDEFVWAAGGFGLWRFDKITETWEHVGSIPTHDVFADRGTVWLATDSGVLRYRRDFNRLEPAPTPVSAFDRIIGTPDRIWFFSPERVVACRPSSAAWSEYRGIDISDYAAAGDSLFVVSRGRVLLYEPGADNWTSFRDIENLPRANGLFVSGTHLVLATDRGLVVDSLAARTARTWTAATGLSSDNVLAGFLDRQLLLAVTALGIDYQDRATGTWKTEPFVPDQAGRHQFLYVDDAGGHLRLLPGTDLRLSGRAYYALSRSFSADSVGRTGHHAVALNLSALHSSNRPLSVYYDDTDKDQVDYGLAYRGQGGDLLRRANAGFFRSEYADFDLVPGFSLLGGSARLRLPFRGSSDSSGPRTVSLQAGRLQSRLRSDFFTGRSLDKNLSLPDVNYARNVFYQVYHPARALARTSDTVFIDDRQPRTNDLDTRLNYTVAGITGDFDPLVRGKGYHIDYDRGVIQFAVPVRPGDVVCLKTETEELVIQSDSVTDHAMENVYLLGPDIIPGSLELTITDTLGNTIPLSVFGLDDDHDGRVDPGLVNHDLGLLHFPAARPFPEPVYTERRRCYMMSVRYRSYSLFYYLSASPVVRNSEEVTVDGEPAARGTDYTIDYTSGTLVFLKPDIVGDYSEIAVRYSSAERDEDALFCSVQPDVALAPGIRVSPGFSHVDSEDMVHLSGRFEAGGDRQGARLVPQVAVNTDGALAQHHTITANFRWLSCRAEYQGIGAGFEPFGVQERRHGDLRHGGSVALGVEPVALLRLDGSLLREYTADTESSATLTSTYSSVRLSYLNQRLPNGYITLGRDMLPDNDKLRLKTRLGHEFTALATRLKLAAILQNTSVTPRPLNASTPRPFSSEYIAEIGFDGPVPISGNLRLRSNRQSDAPDAVQRQLRGRLSVDVIPGFYYVGTCDLGSVSFFLSDSTTGPLDHSLTSFLFNDLRIAPGRWNRHLSLVNFAFGAGTSFDQYCLNLEAPVPVFRLRPLPDAATSRVKELTTLHGSVQLDPFPELMLRYRRASNRGGFTSYSLPELLPATDDEVRVEYQPPALGLLAGQWTRRRVAGYPRTATDGLYFEWTRPWSTRVRTRLTTSGRLNRDAWGTGAAPEVATGELKLAGQLLYRFTTKSFATLDLGASRSNVDTIPSSRIPARSSQVSLLPGLGLNLNLLRFLYLNLSHTSSLPLNGSPTHTLSGRITGQF